MLRSSRFFDKFCRPFAARGLLAGWISGFGQALDALVFPWSCPLCGMEGLSEPFCRSCRRELLEQSAKAAASACPRCALPVGPYADLREGCSVCRGRSMGFDAALAFGPYDQEIRDLCLRLKHERNAWLAPWLSSLLVEARKSALGRLPSDAWIVPVPLHRWRYWQRGYNQAEALAHGLARRLNLPVHRPLRRVVATPKLAELGLTERGQIMHRAFHAQARPELTGRTVVLVDDVLTTGATCGDAARALKQAGATQVVAVVIARAGKSSS
ncbi:MAG: ComF family protein [Isosphaerales bacterium]